MLFGFSYVGLFYLIMLMIPNIIWAKNKPKDYEKYAGNENRILVLLERLGEVFVSVVAVTFSDFNIKPWTLWSLWLAASFILMIFYETYWIRYFRSEKTMGDQYRNFLFFPVAGATLPVIAFLFLGIYGVNILMIIGVTVLGIGHIGIHLAHEKEVKGSKEKNSFLMNILKKTGLGILFLIFAVISFTVGVRNIRFVKHYKNFIKGVEEQTYVTLDGQQQYVLITGEDVSNPVIIYIHGGPATPDIMAMPAFTDELMSDYTIIGWEQRGSGKTYYKNEKKDPKNKLVTIEQSLKDLDELVDYARNRFNQEKIIIMGHSYGTIVGSQYVLRHPEKVTAFISASQVVSVRDGNVLSYEDAFKKAKIHGDDTTKLEKAYKKYMEDKSLLNMVALRIPIAKYHPVPKETNTIWLGLSSPYFGIMDAAWFLRQISIKDYIHLNQALFDYTDHFRAFDMEMNYKVPVYFIAGSEDWICPIELIEQYKNKISAPKKSFTILEGCGHPLQYESPKEFAAFVRRVLK
ncbi:MAG: alpha/beta fold hydrolase [Treponema sp.]|nr:alpha/beta fold hydrolase [Treponema sp.]